ncbi:MAG: glycosyltransferase family 2 protein [Candidatus Omnitrophota bacterium]|nr:glycosyltransferase family 2 protein [Candidatus Omnitrophota bacterium]
MDDLTYCSVVVPIYNEEKNIPELHARLAKVMGSLNKPYEIIYVNDGSVDGSSGLLGKIAALDKNVKIVELSRNFGHQAAVSAGIWYTKGEATIILDADLQDPPALIPEFIKKWQEGYNVVYGIRRKRKESFLKRSCYFIFYRIQEKTAKIKIPLDAGDFCLIDKKVSDILKNMPERNRFIRGMRSWVGFSQAGVEYDRDARFSGKPKYGFRKLMRLAFDGIYSFSDIPLKMSLIAGFFISLMCFLFIIYIVYQRIVHGTSAYGIATIAVSILFLGGIQLIAIGVIGEYIGRIYDEVKQRPVFIVKNLINL